MSPPPQPAGPVWADNPPADLLTWPVRPPEGRLAPDEVHVWCTVLHGGPETLRGLADLLTPDEQTRAQRFRFPRERNRFVVGRGVLRRLLASYLNRPPAEISLTYGPHGKPSLADPAARLRFNLAHSHGVAVYAFSWDKAVGIDVEAVRPLNDLERIARRFFAPGEADRLLALPAASRPRAFFLCWTRKEAWLKAKGTGIGGGLDRFQVTLAPDDPPALIRSQDDPTDPARWRFFAASPAPGYEVALAVEGPNLRPCWRQWREPGIAEAPEPAPAGPVTV